MSVEVLLNLVILLPLAAVAGILATGSKPNVREGVSIVASLVTLLCVSLLYRAFMNGEEIHSLWFELLPGLSIEYRLEALGLMFALIASFLWFITTLYAIGYMRGHHEKNQTRFFAYFAVAISAVMAIAFSENLFTLFVFYEVLTLSTYPLVTHAGTEKAKQGGRTYLFILIGTSVAFFLPAIIGTWAVSGTLSFTAGGVFSTESSPLILSALLVLFAFGIGKAALMPFHRWLPSAMVAPTPVSALLHAVAVVKAGVFTMLKVCVFIFGFDTLAELPVTQWLLYVAALSILLASLIAMRKDNLKARLAYSTVSQLSYITLGALLASSAGLTGSAMHIAMHAFGKITLFFCAGAILVAAHKSEISDMQGLGRRMPLTMAAFFIASVSIIGLPPAGGTWSKWFLLSGTLEAGQWILLGTLMLSSLLNIAYLLPVPLRAFFPTAEWRTQHANDGDTGIKEAPLPSLIAISITTIGCLLLFFYPQFLLELITRI